MPFASRNMTQRFCAWNGCVKCCEMGCLLLLQCIQSPHCLPHLVLSCLTCEDKNEFIKQTLLAHHVRNAKQCEMPKRIPSFVATWWGESKIPWKQAKHSQKLFHPQMTQQTESFFHFESAESEVIRAFQHANTPMVGMWCHRSHPGRQVVWPQRHCIGRLILDRNILHNNNSAWKTKCHSTDWNWCQQNEPLRCVMSMSLVWIKMVPVILECHAQIIEHANTKQPTVARIDRTYLPWWSTDGS